MSGHVEVVVVGAGFAGVAAALELRAGGHEVVVLERALRVGGTWRDNVYPGVACDVPAQLYSLERHPSARWSADFAPGAEIADYLDDVVDTTGLRPHVRLGVALTGADWDDDARLWRLATGGPGGQGPSSAEVLVLACGRLTEPRIPEIPGLGEAPGPVVHTARWDAGLDVAGRHIAVVGTGASAVQLVPELVRRGAEVTLFQRSPAWILPRGGEVYDAAERAALASDPALIAARRAAARAGEDDRFAARAGLGAAAERARADALGHLAAQVADPVLRAALTPADPFGCKRVLLSDDFYPAVASDAVTLEPSALAAVDRGALVSARGTRTAGVDAVVLATGFETTRPPYAALVRGEGGETLAAHWSGGMRAAASTVVAGFPNLFVLGGPHAALAHTSSLLILERQAGFVRRVLAARGEGEVLRVDPAAEAAYVAEIDARTAGRSWLGGCRSWYLDERGQRVTMIWPGPVEDFERMLEGAGLAWPLFVRERQSVTEGWRV